MVTFYVLTTLLVKASPHFQALRACYSTRISALFNNVAGAVRRMSCLSRIHGGNPAAYDRAQVGLAQTRFFLA